MTDFSSEHTLLESFRGGDPNAFSAIREKFYSRLVELSYKITDNKEESENIADETLNRLFEHSSHYESTEQYEDYLFLTTRNSSVDHLQYLSSFAENYKQYVLNNPGTNGMPDPGLDTASVVKLYQSIGRLPETSQRVINYLYLQGMSCQKVAVLLDTTVKEVEHLRADALKQMQ